MAKQRFVILIANPALPGELACASCHAVNMEVPAEPGEPAQELEMEHQEGCEQVSNLTTGAR